MTEELVIERTVADSPLYLTLLKRRRLKSEELVIERTIADFPLLLDSTPLKRRRLKSSSWKELLLISLCTGLHPFEKKATKELAIERTIANFPPVLDSILLKEDD